MSFTQIVLLLSFFGKSKHNFVYPLMQSFEMLWNMLFSLYLCFYKAYVLRVFEYRRIKKSDAYFCAYKS